ncbi:hypothetical protein [Flavobacterium sp.]|uniref:hypothetical protein n=1 Tax=Flavobacterium sp. TaxID=239 RepID=UPI00326444A8
MKNDNLKIPALNFDEKGELIIHASESSSKNDFDFFKGKSSIINRKLKKRLCNCTEWIEFPSTQEMYTILHGIGNIDNFIANFDDKPFEGMTVRLFNPLTKLWSIYWSDSNTGILDKPVIGSFENKVGHFFSKDHYDGRDVIQAFRWDARDQNNPVWSQAMSDDLGKTWEWNWYMFMTKVN